MGRHDGWRTASAIAVAIFVAQAAQASESRLVAERGGFLLGNAHRCGTSLQQLESPAGLVHRLAASLASSDAEQESADQAFAEQFVLSAASEAAEGPVPSCALIDRELTRLVRHRPSLSATADAVMPKARGAPGSGVKAANKANAISAKKPSRSSRRRAEPALRAAEGTAQTAAVDLRLGAEPDRQASR